MGWIIILFVIFLVAILSMVKNKKFSLSGTIISSICIITIIVGLFGNIQWSDQKKISNDVMDKVEEIEWGDNHCLSERGFDFHDNAYILEKSYENGFFVVYVEDYMDTNVENYHLEKYNDNVLYSYSVTGTYESPFPIFQKPESVSRIYHFAIADKFITVREHGDLSERLFEDFILVE